MTAAQLATTAITPPALGAIWPEQGGVYVGEVRGEGGKPNYHLILVSDERAKIRGAWGEYGQDVSDATSIRDGLANTIAMVAAESPIALQVQALVIDGHSDLYIAAPLEASLCNLNAGENLSHDEWHWTSAQYSSNDAWVQDFEYGYQDSGVKDDERPALVVRRLIIQ